MKLGPGDSLCPRWIKGIAVPWKHGWKRNSLLNFSKILLFIEISLWFHSRYFQGVQDKITFDPHIKLYISLDFLGTLEEVDNFYSLSQCKMHAMLCFKDGSLSTQQCLIYCSFDICTVRFLYTDLFWVILSVFFWYCGEINELWTLFSFFHLQMKWSKQRLSDHQS